MNDVAPRNIRAVAQLLHSSGFHRVRYDEIDCCSIRFDDPRTFSDPQPTLATLNAFKANQLRPLNLLNANQGCPTPLRQFQVPITATARAGDRQVRVDSTSARQIVPGRTGLDSTT